MCTLHFFVLLLSSYICLLSRYRPGDIIFSFAGALAHRVSEWQPASVDAARIKKAKIRPSALTPGRIASVFYCHRNVLDYLKDKPPGWFAATLAAAKAAKEQAAKEKAASGIAPEESSSEPESDFESDLSDFSADPSDFSSGLSDFTSDSSDSD